MASHALSLLLLSVAASLVAAQAPFVGTCPRQSVVQNFNVASYLGKWYEQEKYFAIFQAGGKCVTAEYSDLGGGVVGVNNRQVQIPSGRPKTIQGTATLASNNGEAKLNVKFPTAGNFPAPYWVLDTDYNSYALVWSCTNILGFANTQFMWVLTREKNASAGVLATVRNIIRDRGLDASRLQKTPQNCDN